MALEQNLLGLVPVAAGLGPLEFEVMEAVQVGEDPILIAKPAMGAYSGERCRRGSQ